MVPRVRSLFVRSIYTRENAEGVGGDTPSGKENGKAAQKGTGVKFKK
jgi:hypothetical protein